MTLYVCVIILTAKQKTKHLHHKIRVNSVVEDSTAVYWYTWAKYVTA